MIKLSVAWILKSFPSVMQHLHPPKISISIHLAWIYIYIYEQHKSLERRLEVEAMFALKLPSGGTISCISSSTSGPTFSKTSGLENAWWLRDVSLNAPKKKYRYIIYNKLVTGIPCVYRNKTEISIIPRYKHFLVWFRCMYYGLVRRHPTKELVFLS